MEINEFPDELVCAFLGYLTLEEQCTAAASCTKFRICCEKRTAEIQKIKDLEQKVLNWTEEQKLDPIKLKEMYKKMQFFTNSELMEFLKGLDIDPDQLLIIDTNDRLIEYLDYTDLFNKSPELSDDLPVKGVDKLNRPFLAFKSDSEQYQEAIFNWHRIPPVGAQISRPTTDLFKIKRWMHYKGLGLLFFENIEEMMDNRCQILA